jgi:hypothetical protein
MRKESKIIILVLALGILGIIGYTVGMNIEDKKYPIKELLVKYPLISDLKRAVVSGELDYDKLPVGAKEALDKYDSFEKDDTRIIKELSS